MKKITLFLLFFYGLIAHAQLEIPGQIVNKNNKPLEKWYYNPATLLPWADIATILASAERQEGRYYYASGGNVYTFKGGIADANLVLFGGGGGGSGTINTGTAGQMAVYSDTNTISGLSNIYGSSTGVTSNFSLNASSSNSIALGDGVTNSLNSIQAVGSANQIGFSNVAGTSGVSIQNFGNTNVLSFSNISGQGLQIQQTGSQSTLTLGHSAATAANLDLVTTTGTSSKISNSSGGLTFFFTLPNSLATNVPGLQFGGVAGSIIYAKTITNVSNNYTAAIFAAPQLTSATAIGSAVASTTSMGFYIPRLVDNITHGNLYGLRIFGNYSVIQGTGSSVTNAYAAFFEAPTGAINNYALGLNGKLVWKTTLPSTDNTITGVLGLNASGEVVSRSVSTLAPSGANFSKYVATTVSNTITETSILGTGYGTATIAANELTLGKRYRITFIIYTNTSNATSRTLTIRLKIGGTVVNTIANTFSATTTNQYNNYMGEFVCTAVGTGGSILSELINIVVPNQGAATVNTTIANAIDITAQWSDAVVGNTVTCNSLSIVALN